MMILIDDFDDNFDDDDDGEIPVVLRVQRHSGRSDARLRFKEYFWKTEGGHVNKLSSLEEVFNGIKRMFDESGESLEPYDMKGVGSFFFAK